MKKLMIALSAVALTMGVNATVIKGTTFNDRDKSAFENPGESEISDTAFDASSDENVTDYIEEQKGANLAIKTALNAPTYYTLDAAADMNGTFFDSMVKFTYCDEDATVPTGSDAKLMVWVKETEAAGSTAGSTNLMITAGYFSNTEGALNTKIYNCGPISGYGITGADDWARLTIKAIGDITESDSFPGFNVFVNAKLAKIPLGSDNAIGVEGSPADRLTPVANEMKKGNYLFPSMIQDMDAKLQGVGFAGQGAIDNIAFTTSTLTDKGGQPFTVDPIPTIATVNGEDYGDVASINTAISTAPEGAAVVLVSNIEEGDLVFGNGKANTLNLGQFTLDGTITVSSGSLAISGTGTVTGEISAWDGTLTINDGKFESTVGFTDGIVNGGWFKDNSNVEDHVKSGFELKLDTADNYYKVVEVSEDGSAEKPWLINSKDDLIGETSKIKLGDAGKNQHYKLTQSFDLGGVTWPGIGLADGKDYCTADGKSFDDFKAGAFTGIFDGNGQTISGVTIQGGDYNGFFNSAYKATITNLKLGIANNGVAETSASSDALFVGSAFDCELTNLEAVKGEVEGTTTFTTGKDAAIIVGYMVGGMVSNCVNNLNVMTTPEKDDRKAGGLVLITQNGGTEKGAEKVTSRAVIADCVNNGDVATSKNGTAGVAGILGYVGMETTIKNVTNNGNVTTAAGGTPYGITGHIDSGKLTMDGVNKVDASIKSAVSAVDGLKFATVENGVATLVKDAALVKDGQTTYKVMVAGVAVTLNRGESITLDETLATATVSPADAENDEVVKSGNTYTCQAIPTATVSITKTNADATISVADGATVKRDTVITVTGVTPAAGYKDAKVTIAGAELDTYTVKGDEGTIAIVVSATAIPVTGIELDITETNVAPNVVFTLTATVQPDDAHDKTVTWEVTAAEPAGCVTVDDKGEVTAVAVGTATITAKAGEKSATCEVTVAAPGPIEKDPEEPIAPPTGKSATEYADELNANGGAGAAALVKAPAGVTGDDIATFKSCFKAAVDGDNVKLVLDEKKAATTIVPNLNAAEAAIVEGGFGSEVSVTVIPGLYYGITAQADVTDMAADPANWVQATSANKDSFKLDVPEVKVGDVKSDKAFFQVKCSDVDTKKE